MMIIQDKLILVERVISQKQDLHLFCGSMINKNFKHTRQLHFCHFQYGKYNVSIHMASSVDMTKLLTIWRSIIPDFHEGVIVNGFASRCYILPAVHH